MHIKRFCSAALLVLFSAVAFAQAQADSVYNKVDTPPRYPGGLEAMQFLIARNMQYPQSAAESLLEGKVQVMLVINTDGTMSDIKVYKSLSKDCDAEALRLIALFPKWKAGKAGGKAVRTRTIIPILFKNVR